MPCQAPGINCRIYKVYIADAGSSYHGELCAGCRWWLETPEDQSFKRREEHYRLSGKPARRF